LTSFCERKRGGSQSAQKGRFHFQGKGGGEVRTPRPWPSRGEMPTARKLKKKGRRGRKKEETAFSFVKKGPQVPEQRNPEEAFTERREKDPGSTTVRVGGKRGSLSSTPRIGGRFTKGGDGKRGGKGCCFSEGPLSIPLSLVSASKVKTAGIGRGGEGLSLTSRKRE